MRQRAGLRPDPAGGAYSALPDPLAGLRGSLRGRGGEGEEEGREGERRGRKGKGRRGAGKEGRGGEIDSDVQLEQDRRLAKAGPE